MKAKPGEVLLFNLCGHGNFDMTAWTAYNEGKLVDYEYPEGEVAQRVAADAQGEGQYRHDGRECRGPLWCEGVSPLGEPNQSNLIARCRLTQSLLEPETRPSDARSLTPHRPRS